MPRKGLLLSTSFDNFQRFDDAAQAKLAQLLASNDVWGVGPLSLDPQADLGMDQQEALFRAFVKAAVQANVAIEVLSGPRQQRQLAILKEEGVDFSRVVLVNNTMGMDQLQPWLDAGCFVAFDGYLTYEENAELREAAKAMPLSQMLCASNEPFVAPSAISKVPGGTEDVVWVIGEIADLRMAYNREAFMEIYDCLLTNAMTVLSLSSGNTKGYAWYH